MIIFNLIIIGNYSSLIFFRKLIHLLLDSIFKNGTQREIVFSNELQYKFKFFSFSHTHFFLKLLSMFNCIGGHRL